MINEQTIRAIIDHLESLKENARRDAQQAADDRSYHREDFFEGKSFGLEIALSELYNALPGDE